MTVKAHGEFIKQSGYTFRQSAYIQWGDSEDSIGSCLLLNPGSADFRDYPSLEQELDRLGSARGEIRTDPTMQQLITLVEQIYGSSELNGRFHIYNLFSLQNPKSTNAIEEFKRLVSSGEYDPSSSLVSKVELTANPWILLGWGCDEESFSDELHAVKEQWIQLISNCKVPCFGKKHPKGKGYYHPCPLIPTQRPGIISDLIAIYQHVIGRNYANHHKSAFQVFNVHDTKQTTIVKGPALIVPEVEWRGWTFMSENPEDILKGFSHLTVDERYKLRAYQYMDGMGSNGVVWAIPRDKELPHPWECETVNSDWNTPKPSFACNDFMEAIVGDRSPLSYLQAAVLIHELWEFGAGWHGVGWGTHKILPFDENDVQEKYEAYSSEWTMQMDEPDLWEPHFFSSTKGEPTIIFYTVDCVHQKSINRFTHVFSNDNYTMRITRDVVAYGNGGIIF